VVTPLRVTIFATYSNDGDATTVALSFVVVALWGVPPVGLAVVVGPTVLPVPAARLVVPGVYVAEYVLVPVGTRTIGRWNGCSRGPAQELGTTVFQRPDRPKWSSKSSVVRDGRARAQYRSLSFG
jgi:hypothetical protein